MWDYSSGKIAFILVVSALLASAGAWVLAARYHATMRRLMSAPLGDVRAGVPAASTTAPIAASRAPAAALTLADNRRAGWRVSLFLVVLSVLIATSAAALFLVFSLGPDAFTPKRLAVLALVHCWPIVPALALMWRWSKWRLLGVLVLWCVFAFAVMLWRSIEPQPLMLLAYLALDIGPPLLLVALLCLGSATRAVALWLLVPMCGLVWASIVGIDLLAWFVERRSPWLMNLPAWLHAEAVMLAFALLPWLLAWWPLRSLGRRIGRAYAQKRLSELLVLFTAVWAVTLVYQALGMAHELGAGGAVMLLPLLWIPLGAALFARLVPPPAGRAPTLLVLRVFQHDAQVQSLYDHVVERWRLSGNTVLIAGTDLVARTTDADDIFTFLDGRLAQRFIRSAADVAPRLAAFDLAPDLDGRYRVNECYCHDSTWQDALHALVDTCDVVLMDLRGFQAHNAGCRFELATLARSTRLARAVVLVDAATDRATALADTRSAPAGRFVWIDASRTDRQRRRATLAALFGKALGEAFGDTMSRAQTVTPVSAAHPAAPKN